MEQGQSLDELLNDEPQVDRPRDEHGRFASKTGVEEPQEPVIEPDPAEPVPPTEPKQEGLPKDVYEPLRAVRDENKQLREQIEALSRQIQQPQQPPAPPPSLWEDEQGWQQHFGQNLVSTAVQQASLNSKLEMSEMLVRQANPDFDAVKAEFLALAEQNPAIAQQALADPHPWNKAYQIAKNHRTMQEMGATNLDELKAKIREELLNEAQAQVPAQRQVPPSLSTERNVGSRSGPAWTGPASLDELLR